MQLYLIPSPRHYAICSDRFALVFRPPPQEQQDSPDVVVEFLPRSQLDTSNAVLVGNKVFGCLGVLRMGQDTFLPIITSAITLSTHTGLTGPGAEPISRILSVSFFCLTSPLWDTYSSSNSNFDSYGSTSNVADDYDMVPSSSSAPGNGLGPGGDVLEHPCAGIRKILSNGCFYFSGSSLETSSTDSFGEDAADVPAFDITSNLQVRLGRTSPPTTEEDPDGAEEHDSYEEDSTPHFLWNTYLISPLLSFRRSLPAPLRKVLDREAFIVRAMQGYCGTHDVSVGGQQVVLSLISRLGWKRAGTRFNVRGVDDDGSVANFVETETIFRTSSLVFSYVQIRGSVPLFWEEVGIQPFGLKITITRPIEASLPAFTRHFTDLIDTYSSLHIINLLSSKDQEAQLTDSYALHLDRAGLRDQVGLTAFDFHARSKLGGIESVRNQLSTVVGDVGETFGACVASVDGGEEGTTVVMNQRGVFRTNCKDCLDRTNVVQDMLSGFAILDYIRNTNPSFQGSDSRFWTSHRILWAENGDSLSKIYVGTGAINTSFTRSGKKSFAGILSDATKSVGRMYQSTVNDPLKQKSIDALLGHLSSSQKVRVFNPINDALRASLKQRASEFTTYTDTTIWVGTYNLNGKGPGSESLLPWLFPGNGPEPSFLVIAFQEIVPLTPQMIMATDPEKKRRWEAHILKTVSERPDKKSDYILLRSGQLVGTALIVLCKTELADDVRNVEAATKKTGLKGMAGNKGAVAIRLDYRDTSFCFLTAHLAAGHNNLEERNSDYFTIAEGLHFSRGRGISQHDNIVWAADTNYRIQLPNDEVRRMAEEDNYARLFQDDQLAFAMRTRNVFAGYYEAPILFRPTYKYDNGTEIYDSSEKRRIPAWTDRILYSGMDLDVSRYQRAELFSSDHRPVYAIFRAKIRRVDHLKRSVLRKSLLQEIITNSPEKGADGFEKLRQGFSDALSPLPPPSDDQQAWWNGPNNPDGTYLPDPSLVQTRNHDVSNPFTDNFFTRKKPPPVPAAKKPLSLQSFPAPASSSPVPSPRQAPLTPASKGSFTTAASAIVRPSPQVPPPTPPRPIPVPEPVTSSMESDPLGASTKAPVARKVPPPPPRVPILVAGDEKQRQQSLLSTSPAALATNKTRRAPPAIPARPGSSTATNPTKPLLIKRSSSASSLLDSDEETPHTMGSWHVIETN
ncbi:hypothetical protein T439DRAFT_8341 [Meredithblackwellia eburnea MCA 4105]